MSFDVKISNEKVTPYGGLIPILKLIKDSKIPQLIRSFTKKRPFWSTFSNEDAIIGLAMNIFCGKNRISQIERFRKKLSIIPNLKLPSHDTIGRVLKNLSTVSYTKETVDKFVTKTEVNYNSPLNELLIKATKRLGLFQSGKTHTLDVDATFINTKCKDAKANTRKKSLGYSPMVCMIGRMPVHISLRSGNASGYLNVREDVESCINMLSKNNVKVGRVRSDAAGYNKDFLDYLNNNGIFFNIRMPFMTFGKTLVSSLRNCNNWENTIIETSDYIWECEIGEFRYNMNKSTTDYRIICLRQPDKETKKNSSEEEFERIMNIEERMKQIDEKGLINRKGKLHEDVWTNFEGYDYKMIITNDFETSAKDLMLEYNKRGGAERNFEYLKKDFGWKYPPFMYMEDNNVYLIITALINNIFIGSLMSFKKYTIGFGYNSRLPKFIDIFILISCKIEETSLTFYPNTEDIDFIKLL